MTTSSTPEGTVAECNARVRSHTLCGIEVYWVQEDALPGRSWHQLSNGHPMLAIVVNEEGGLCEARPSLNIGVNRSNLHRRNGHASLKSM